MFILKIFIFLQITYLLISGAKSLAQTDEDYDEQETRGDDDENDYENSSEYNDFADDKNLVVKTSKRTLDVPPNFLGSNLFGNKGDKPKQCFTAEDVALLAARMNFEVPTTQIFIFFCSNNSTGLIPYAQKIIPNRSETLEDDQSVQHTLEFIYAAQEICQQFTAAAVRQIAHKALDDLIGAYLHHLYLPLVKFAFYAGELTYKSVRLVLALHQQCLKAGNTAGGNWREPIRVDATVGDYKIKPINISLSDFDVGPPCANLILTDRDDETNPDAPMLVDLPKFEPTESDAYAAESALRFRTSIWLPFRRRHSFDLSAQSSAFILIRYYVAVTKCYLFRNEATRQFRHRFGQWLVDNALPLIDEDTNETRFYPGFGAIYRIVETLRAQAPDYADEVQLRMSASKFSEAAASSRPPALVDIENQVKQMQNGGESSFFAKLLRKDGANRNALWITLGVAFGVGLLITFTGVLLVCRRRVQQSNRKGKSKKRRKYDEEDDDDDEYECKPKSPSIMATTKLPTSSKGNK